MNSELLARDPIVASSEGDLNHSLSASSQTGLAYDLTCMTSALCVIIPT